MFCLFSDTIAGLGERICGGSDGGGRTGGAALAVSGVSAVECGLRVLLTVFAAQLHDWVDLVVL